jgi:hypothetical protein
VGDLPVGRILLEHAVVGVDHVCGRRVLVGRLRIAPEHPPEPREILVATQCELVLFLWKGPHRLVVALSGRRVGPREPVVSQRQLGEPRETRLRDHVVRERLPGERIDDGSAEAPGELVRGGNSVETGGAAVDSRPFVIDQEERPIAPIVDGQHHRTTGDEPELLLIQLRLRRAPIIEIVPRVPAFIPEEPEGGPAELVGARLADEIDLVGAEPVLGRVRRRLLLELLNRIDGKNRGRRAERRVDIRGPIDHEVVRRRPRAHDADRIADALPHGSLLASGLDRSSTEEQELQEIAAVQRQLGDLPLGDRLAHGRIRRIEGEHVRLHLDGLRHIAKREHHVDALNLVDGQRQVRVDGRLEPGLLTRDDVGSDREQRNDVVATAAGPGLAREAGQLIGDDDFHAGHHGTRRIAHRPGNLAGRGLAPAGCVHAQERRQRGAGLSQERSTSHEQSLLSPCWKSGRRSLGSTSVGAGSRSA